MGLRASSAMGSANAQGKVGDDDDDDDDDEEEEVGSVSVSVSFEDAHCRGCWQHPWQHPYLECRRTVLPRGKYRRAACHSSSSTLRPLSCHQLLWLASPLNSVRTS